MKTSEEILIEKIGAIRWSLYAFGMKDEIKEAMKVYAEQAIEMVSIEAKTISGDPDSWQADPVDRAHILTLKSKLK